MAGLEVAWALAIVLALLGVIRLGARLLGFDAAVPRNRSLRVVESCALGPKRRVLLVEAESERLLLASSEAGISLLRVLPESGSEQASAAPTTELEIDAAQSTDGEWKRRWIPTLGRTGLVALALLASLGDAGVAHAAAEISGDSLVLSLAGAEGSGGLSSSIELLLLLTFVTVAPSLLLMATCFTRIVIVLAFVRQALGVQHLPPNQVLVGLALFLTLFVMAPLGETIKTQAFDPYTAGEIETTEAVERAMVPIRRYLMSYTGESDLALFEEVSQRNGANAPAPDAEPGITVLLPAFLLSELRTAFQIGFTIFLPFLVIDLVIASMLISMGMIVLPPIVVSLPFKLMLFVLVDGWNLVLGALVDGLR